MKSALSFIKNEAWIFSDSYHRRSGSFTAGDRNRDSGGPEKQDPSLYKDDSRAGDPASISWRRSGESYDRIRSRRTDVHGRPEVSRNHHEDQDLSGEVLRRWRRIRDGKGRSVYSQERRDKYKADGARLMADRKQRYRLLQSAAAKRSLRRKNTGTAAGRNTHFCWRRHRAYDTFRYHRFFHCIIDCRFHAGIENSVQSLKKGLDAIFFIQILTMSV